jgi:hypothetical protein
MLVGVCANNCGFACEVCNTYQLLKGLRRETGDSPGPNFEGLLVVVAMGDRGLPGPNI